MNEHEMELVKEISPALDMLSALAEGCRKAMILEPTYSALLLVQLHEGVINPPPNLKGRSFLQLSSNYTARGCEAIMVDTENGQKYHVAIEPIPIDGAIK